jgi:hypothetical protein
MSPASAIGPLPTPRTRGRDPRGGDGVAVGLQRAGLVRIEALLDPDNAASRRVVEKAGFRREGRLRSYLLLDGRHSTRWPIRCWHPISDRRPPGLTTPGSCRFVAEPGSTAETAAAGYLQQRRPRRSNLPTLLVCNKQPPQPRQGRLSFNHGNATRWTHADRPSAALPGLRRIANGLSQRMAASSEALSHRTLQA